MEDVETWVDEDGYHARLDSTGNRRADAWSARRVLVALAEQRGDNPKHLHLEFLGVEDGRSHYIG